MENMTRALRLRALAACRRPPTAVHRGAIASYSSGSGPRDDHFRKGAYHEVQSDKPTRQQQQQHTPQNQGQRQQRPYVARDQRGVEGRQGRQGTPTIAQQQAQAQKIRGSKLPQYALQFDKKTGSVGVGGPLGAAGRNQPSTAPLDSLLTSTPLVQFGRSDLARFAVAGNTALGWPKALEDQFILLRERLVMVREPAVAVMEALRANQEGKGGKIAMPTILVHGNTGTGKSTTVAHIANACSAAGWLVLYVPDALQHTVRSMRIEPSKWRQGRIDQWTDAADLLLAFKTANQKLLSQVKVTHAYDFESAKISRGQTLLDLVNVGAGPYDIENLTEPPPSCDVLGAVCKELKNVTSVPVLVAVDAFNAYYNTTELYGFDAMRLHAMQLSIARFFTKFTLPGHGLKNGAFVAGLTETGVPTFQKFSPEIRAMLKQSERMVSSAPVTQEQVKELMRVRVGEFSSNEMRNFLSLYRHKGLLSREVDTRVVAEMAGLTGSLPSEAARICAFV